MSKMGHLSAELQESQVVYETLAPRHTKEDCKWALENALKATGALDSEPTDAFFKRVIRYASEILLTLEELQNG
tara:strand:+ start:118 stop:339 length:222 start_codon:yes stop_codon:yes gene_type:complete